MLDKAQDDSGFYKPADQLIEHIRQHYQRWYGQALSSKEVKKIANDVIESRL